MPTAARRLVALLVLVAGFLLPPTAAIADPAGPTNYRTTIVSITPDVPGMALEVFGGDSFLVLTLEPGVEAIVYGYEHDEAKGIVDPYLRFNADGTVEVNRRSPARWQNENRYAAVEEPDFVDPTAPPDWELVGEGGEYAWHDHRIHWMSPALPERIDPSLTTPQRVFDERPVPMTVDGVDVTAVIVLDYDPSPSALPWILVALVVAAVAFVIGRRPAALPAVVVGAAGLALAVSLGSAVGLPAGVGREVAPLLLPVVALAAGVLAFTRDEDGRAVVVALAALPLLGWAVVQSGALTAPIVPSQLPVVLIRAGVAVTAGVGLAALAAVASSLFGGDLSSLADLAESDDEGAPA